MANYAAIHASDTKIVNVQDWALCNNGDPADNPYLNHVCFTQSQHSHPVTCDNRNIAPSNCSQLSIIISSTETAVSYKQALQSAFQQSDNDNNIRRLSIVYPLAQYQTIIEYIDELLTPRPWLYIRQEIFPWMLTNASKTSTTMTSMTMTIDKYHHQYEPYLHYLAAVNYPTLTTATTATSATSSSAISSSATSSTSSPTSSHSVNIDYETCNKAIFMINRHTFIHAGWGGSLSMYLTAQERLPFGITAIYISDSNNGSHDMAANAFINPEDCSLKNRWQCALLSTTHCPLPIELTECQTKHCISKLGNNHMFFALLYHNNTPLLSIEEMETKNESKRKHNQLWLEETAHRLGKHPLNEQQRQYYEHKVPELHTIFLQPTPVRSAAGAAANDYAFPIYNLSDNNLIKHHIHWLGTSKIFYEFGYLLRFSATYRSWLYQSLHTFLQENQLTMSKRDDQFNSLLFSPWYHQPATSLSQPATVSASENQLASQSAQQPTKQPVASQPVASQPVASHPAVDSSSHKPKGEKFRCIAVHIRRTDKLFDQHSEITKKHANISDHRIQAKKTCEELLKQSEGDGLTRGCGQLSFASLKFSMIVQVVDLIADVKVIKNLLVLTDDELWLRKEKRAYYQEHAEKVKAKQQQATMLPAWKIYHLPAPWFASNDSTSITKAAKEIEKDALYIRLGTKAGIYFLKGLLMVRQCEGLVGHFVSAIPNMMLASMWFAHAGKQGVCPPKVDLRYVYKD